MGSCLLAGGCVNGAPAPGATLTYQDDFFPDELPDKAVVLRLANIDIEAEIESGREGQERILKIVSDGTVVEEERYRVTTEGIWLVQLRSGESFAEPLPLMKFPMEVGKSFTWTGKVAFDRRFIDAEAEIASRREQLSLATGQTEAVHIQVDLRINDGSPRPAQRRLDFWFVKDKGPVKRDFGNQVREPRAAE